MRELQWIDEVPVVMISSEESVEIMRKAYDLGITDYISRPFDAVIVKKKSPEYIRDFMQSRND